MRLATCVGVDSHGRHHRNSSAVIVVYASGNKADITKVNKEDGKEIVHLIRAHLSAAKDNPAQVVVQAAAPAVLVPDVTEQLRKLGELHAADILTDAEFSAKKAALLDRL